MHQRCGERQPLLVTCRQCTAGCIGVSDELKVFHDCRNTFIFCLAGKSVNTGEECKVLLHGQIAVQRKTLRHVADACTGLCGGGTQIHTGDTHTAGRNRQQSAEHAKGGRFARTVGAQQAKDFAAPDFKTDMTNGYKITEFPAQITNLNDAGRIFRPV